MSGHFINPNWLVNKNHSLYGFPEPGNENMVAIIDMYHNTFITLTFILFGIAIIFTHIVVYFRSSVNPYPILFTKWQESLIDAFVVLIPVIIIYYLSVPAVGYVLHNNRFLQELEATFTIEIVGHQWYWSYYLDCIQNAFFFDFISVIKNNSSEDVVYGALYKELHDYLLSNENYQIEFDQMMDLDAPYDTKCFQVNKVLVLPVFEYIRCLITSEDVVHSWALPQLGIKVDALPGRIQMFILNSSRPSLYYGQCSELCGVNHGFMPLAVEFVNHSLFLDWYLKNLDVRPYKTLFFLDEVA